MNTQVKNLGLIGLVLASLVFFAPQAKAEDAVCPAGNAPVILNGAVGSGASFSVTGNQATATFHIAPGCTNIPVTLLSFAKASTTDLLPQTVIDKATGVFNGGDQVYSLTVNLQSCQMQADVFAGIWNFLDLSESNIQFAQDHTLDWIYNNTACEQSVTPPATPPPPPTDVGGTGEGLPTLTVTKVVVNDNGGTAQVSDFSLKAGAINVTSGVAVPLGSGTYAITESGPTGYEASFSGDCDSNGQVIITVGDFKCTLTNNDISQGQVLGIVTPPPESQPDVGGGEITVPPIGGVHAGGPPSSIMWGEFSLIMILGILTLVLRKTILEN